MSNRIYAYPSTQMETIVIPNTLTEFLEHEIQKRGLSYREFAKLVGVSHRTINQLLDQKPQKKRQVSASLLLKLSKATGVNIVTLMSLAYPDVAESVNEVVGMDATSLLRLQRIQELPENLRDAVDTIIFQRAQLKKANNGV